VIEAFNDFAEFVQVNAPLAPHTHLKLGGPAEALAQPRTVQELGAVVRRCADKKLPLRLLGNGCNVLVKDEGVRGVVLRLKEPAFTNVSVDGRRLRAGCGAALSALISQAARHGLAGLETLVGIPGTVGGALRQNAGERSGEIGQYIRRVDTIDSTGHMQTRDRDELAYGSGSDEDPVLLTAEFELDAERALPLGPRRCYFNSGTWARLIQLAPAVLGSATAFQPVYEAMEKGQMSDLDAVPGLVLARPAVVAFWADDAGTHGELRHLAGDRLEPVERTHFLRAGK